MTQKAFIAGGTGFVGVNAANELARKGYAVTVMGHSDKKPPGLHGDITLLAGDSRFPGDWQKAVTASSLVINLAGRQRMLSQRRAKFYFLREWGFDSLTIQAEQEAARNEFEGALSPLAAAPENSKEITKALEEVSLQWAWFKHAVSLQGEEAFRLIVADSSEEILQSMEEITGQYQEISGNETAH